jgi:hypothetical protein
MFRGAALVVALIVLGAAAALAAEPPEHIAIRLTYTLEPGTPCPPEKVLHDEVARHLGYDPFREDALGRITVRILPKGRQVYGLVEGADLDGGRPWSRDAAYPAESCPVLISWLGTVIAFHLDQERSRTRALKPSLTEVPPPTPSSSSSPPPPAAPPTSQLSSTPSATTPPPQATPTGRVALGLGPLLSISSSGPSYGVLAYAGFQWPVLSLGGELRYDAPSSALVNTPTRWAKVHASAVGGTLVPCAHLRGAFLCALFSGGVVLGSTSGLDLTRQWNDFYLGAGLRLGAEQAIVPWLSVRLHLDGMLMFQTTATSLYGTPVQLPTPLSSRVNGATGLDLLTYF